MMMHRRAPPCSFTAGGGVLWRLLVLLPSASSDSSCVKGIPVPPSTNTSSWPPLFRLTSPNPADPTLPNMDEEAGHLDPSVLLSAGVVHYKLDPAGYDYPNGTKQIPWSPPLNGTNDPALQELRDEKDYQYADIVVVSAFAEKFYEEHLHAGGDEVRYVIDGSGYFDIRDLNDEWVRLHAGPGDVVEFPTGIEHRFSVDSGLYVQAMRLFPGSDDPDWSSVPRSEIHGNNTSRNAYVEKYLCGIDPDPDGDVQDHGSHGEEAEACVWQGMYPIFCTEEEAAAHSEDGKFHSDGYGFMPNKPNGTEMGHGGYKGDAPACECEEGHANTDPDDGHDDHDHEDDHETTGVTSASHESQRGVLISIVLAITTAVGFARSF